MEKLDLSSIQKSSLEILKTFRDICVNLNLKYFLTYGTLIGAIRHNGFIPWDDDLDVMMPRQDYENLIKFYKENKSKFKGLELFHYTTNKKYHYAIARLSNPKYIMKSSIDKDCGMGTFIDIYPIDGGFDELDIFSHYKIVIYRRILYAKNSTKKIERTFKKFIGHSILKTIGLFFNNRTLIKKIEKIAKKRPYNLSKFVGCTIWENELFNSYLFDETILHKFEDDYFMIPKEYDAILKQTYGNYMQLPPISERTAHHCYEIYLK